MRYIIGDVARTLGLTTAGLHYFEKEGVIAPRKGAETRRFYDAEDIIRLISYKKYRAMEMPMKEIVHQFSPEGENCDGIIAKMHAQQEQMRVLSRKYAQLAEDIRWFEEGISRVQTHNGEIDLAIMPECCTLSVGKDGLISRNKEEQNLIASWLECMPSTRLSVFGYENGTAAFGYSLPLERAIALGLDRTPGAQQFKSCVALHMCRQLSRTYFNHPELAFTPLWEEMQRRGFQQAGPALGVHFCVDCSQGKREILCELWLPIQ